MSTVNVLFKLTENMKGKFIKTSKIPKRGPMKKIKLFFTAVVILFLLSGCFQIERVIKVNKDGSGTLDETVLMSQQFIDQMKQMAASFGGGEVEEDKRDESEYHDVEELKANAAKLGENVKYVSSEPLEVDNKLGYHAVYSFEDITKLTLVENPAEDLMSNTQTDEEDEDLQFKFKEGKTSELTIIFPNDDEEEEIEELEYEESTDAVSDQDINMMKAMYSGMKVSVKVMVDGKVVYTNAIYQDDNVITLSEMDFDVIMENDEAFKTLAGNDERSDEELKIAMQKYEGFKADLNKEVIIKFK